MSTADGYLHREMDSHGVRAKADVLGVQVAELRAGYIHSKEKESRQVSFHGKEAHMHRDTSFEGLGTDVRIGSGQAPGARLQSGLGRFQESISCASKDGTESFHSQQMGIGGHTKASLAGKTMDLRAGYIHSKEKESRQVSFHGKEAHMHRDTSFEGLGTDVRIGSGQAPGARLQSGLGRFQESISCASKDGTESFHSQQMVIGGHTKASLAGKTMDLRAGYIHSKEQESRQVSFHGKEAHMHRETSFEGFGADVRSGSGQAPGARLQSGLGRFQESISCASKDGTEQFLSETDAFGASLKAAVDGASVIEVQAGLGTKEELHTQISQDHKGQLQVASTASSNGGLFLKGNVLGVAGLSVSLGSKEDFHSVTTHTTPKRSEEDFSRQCLNGLSCSTTTGSRTSDWSTGRLWNTQGRSIHDAQGRGVTCSQKSVSNWCDSFEDKFIGYTISDETQQYESRRVTETYGLEQSKGRMKPMMERQIEHQRNLQTGQETTIQTVSCLIKVVGRRLTFHFDKHVTPFHRCTSS